MTQNDQWVEIDKKIFKLARALPKFSSIFPNNFDEEKKLFLSGGKINPRFTYKSLKLKRFAEKFVQIIIPVNEPLSTFFESVLEQTKAYYCLLQNIGTDKFTNTDLYGQPTKKLVNEAKELLIQLADETANKEKLKNDSGAKEVFQAELNRYNLSDWKIKIKPMTAKVAVDVEKKTILIKENAIFSDEDLKRFLVHEIETHVFRTVNGFKQPFLIFATAFIPGYLPTEEGLAVYNEIKAGLLTNHRLRIFTGRVLAVDYSLRLSFRDTYNKLLQFFEPETAFQLTFRAKRGLSDTSKPGGFIKDHVYLEGKFLIDEYVSKGGDLKLLYSGKIGINNLTPTLTKILKPPRLLPNYLKS